MTSLEKVGSKSLLHHLGTNAYSRLYVSACGCAKLVIERYSSLSLSAPSENSPLWEALQQRVRLTEVLLDLLAAVKDGAVARGAQHVLVQASLAPLALRPQRTELLLQLVHSPQ